MFKPTSICLSALSKRTNRVKVQILKDLEAFNLRRGQVLDVKPAMMRNYLHNNNGAKYILAESDVNKVLLHQYEKNVEESRARSALLTERAELSNKVKGTSKQETEKKIENSGKQKSVLDNEISIKDVFIPGLDL